MNASHTYDIELTQDDIRAFVFAGDIYGWAYNFPVPTKPGIVTLEEQEAWQWKGAVEADMEGGHSPFALLDPEFSLYEKLTALYERIV